MDNYFSFYDMEITFFPDKSELKRKFFGKSKELHPDYHTQASEEQQQRALLQSAYNNVAYKILKNEDARMKYVLELTGALSTDGSQKLVHSFLIEMMEINEGLMELQMNFDQAGYDRILEEINMIEKDLYDAAEPAMRRFSNDHNEIYLSSVLDYYLKKKYLLRIRENLDRFAQP